MYQIWKLDAMQNNEFLNKKIEENLIQSSESHEEYIMTLNKQINRYLMLAGKKLCIESKSDICLIEFYKYN